MGGGGPVGGAGGAGGAVEAHAGGAGRGTVRRAGGASSPAHPLEDAPVITIECPRCRDTRPEGLADCPRCADRAAVRALLARVPAGKLRDRLNAVESMVLDVLLADALEAAGGNQTEAARRLDHRQPGVFEMLHERPHLLRAWPPKAGAPAGTTSTRERDAKGRLHGRVAPPAPAAPAAPAKAPPPKPRAKASK